MASGPAASTRSGKGRVLIGGPARHSAGAAVGSCPAGTATGRSPCAGLPRQNARPPGAAQHSAQGQSRDRPTSPEGLLPGEAPPWVALRRPLSRRPPAREAVLVRVPRGGTPPRPAGQVAWYTTAAPTPTEDPSANDRPSLQLPHGAPPLSRGRRWCPRPAGLLGAPKRSGRRDRHPDERSRPVASNATEGRTTRPPVDGPALRRCSSVVPGALPRAAAVAGRASRCPAPCPRGTGPRAWAALAATP